MLKSFESSVVIFFILLVSFPLLSQSSKELSIDDLTFLNGLYTGTLTYKDYSSDQTVTLPLVCNTFYKNDQILQKILINEGGKNYEQDYKFRIKDGKVDGFELVSQIINVEDNAKAIELIISQKGKDGNQNRPCTFKYTIKGDQSAYAVTKEVKFDDEASYFIRNQYRFKRLESLKETEKGFTK